MDINLQISNSYSQNQSHRSIRYMSLFSSASLPYNPRSNTLCYTHSKSNFIYKPHSEKGMVGTTSAGSLSRRRRI
jgi:hypothetical protein